MRDLVHITALDSVHTRVDYILDTYFSSFIEFYIFCRYNGRAYPATKRLVTSLFNRKIGSGLKHDLFVIDTFTFFPCNNVYPSSKKSTFPSHCSRLTVCLLSYGSRSTLLRLDCRKKYGWVFNTRDPFSFLFRKKSISSVEVRL